MSTIKKLLFLFFIINIFHFTKQQKFLDESFINTTNNQEINLLEFEFIEHKQNTDNEENKRPLTATDVQSLNRLSGSSLTADAKYLVYQLSKWDSETGIMKTTIFYYDIEEKKEYSATFDGNSPTIADNLPNKMFYLTNDSLSIRVIEFPFLESSVSSEVFALPIPIETFKISLNGNAFAFSARIYHGDGNDLEKTAQKDKEIAARGENTYVIYDQLMVNHWDVWNDHKVSNIFYQKIKDDGKGGFVKDGELLNIMQDLPESNCPVPPFGGSEMYDISTDGSEIVFTSANRKDEAVNTSWRTYYVVASKGNVPTDISTNEDAEKNFIGRTNTPLFSDDGEDIYFTTMPRDQLESDYMYLASYNKANKTYTKHTIDFKYGISGITLHKDKKGNKKALLNIDYDGSTEVFVVDLKSEKPVVTPLTSWETIPSSKMGIMSVVTRDSDNKTLVYYEETSDLFPMRISVLVFKDDAFDSKAESSEVIYDPNLNFHDEFLKPSKQIKIEFDGATKGMKTQGWVIQPVNFDDKKKYPIAFIIHGGPEGSLGNIWSYRWNPLLWASQGFVVVMVNPEGSTGKGQDFTDAVRNDWGGKPYQTLMKGLDYVIENFTYVDGDRACAAGASYGGYMVNWIQGNTKRFKCLVTHDGVFSTLSMFYITDELWFPLAEYCEKPGCLAYKDKDREGFTKFSPDTLVDNWSTPHLIIHGSNDLRIPVSEGISAFTALQLKKVPSKFIHFPHENHWVLKPENSIGWYENVIGWMKKYTMDNK